MTTPVRRVAGLTALLLIAGTALPAAAAIRDDAVVFEAMTTAVGLSLSSTQKPAASVVTGGLVDLTSAYASSALSSAGASASSAAPVYPGDLVATGPALLCAQFLPCPVTPPAYPLLAQASWPDRPTGAAESPAPLGTATAAAAEQLTQGATQASSVAVPGTPVVVSVGAQRTGTRAWADAGGAHVRATSALNDVAIGPLRIASLAATDAVDVAGAGAVSDHPTVTMTGVTFQGSAATVDQDGVHVLGTSQASPAGVLSAQGLDIRSISSTRTDGPGAARSTAGGLQVTFSVPVSGVPAVVPGLPGANRSYLGSLMVGGVGVAASAGAAGADVLASLPPLPPTSLAARLLPTGTAVGPATASTTTTSSASPVVATPVAGRRRLPLPQPDLQLLALLLAVVPPLLLVGWRVGVSVRRGRS